MADLDPFATATELLAALGSGRVTATELADVYIRRIERYDEAPQRHGGPRLRAGPPPGPGRGRGHRPRRAGRPAGAPHDDQGVVQCGRPAHDVRRAGVARLRLEARRPRSRAPGRPAPSFSARRTSRPCWPTGSPPTPSTDGPTIPGTSSARPAARAGAAPRQSPPGLSALEVGSDIGGSIRVPAVVLRRLWPPAERDPLAEERAVSLSAAAQLPARHGRAGSDRPQRRGPGAGAVHPRRPRNGRGRSLAGRVAARPAGTGSPISAWRCCPDPVAGRRRRDPRALEELARRASAGSAPPSRRSSPMSSGTIGSITSCTGRCSPR